MRRSHLFGLLATAIPILVRAEDACGSTPNPIVLKVASIPIHPFNTLRRGIAVSIGTPPQQFAFQIDT